MTNTTPPHLGEVIVTWNDDAYHYSASSSLHVVSSTGGQACEIVPRSVVMCAGGTLQMAVRYSDAGTWSVSGPWGGATGAGAASITSGGLLTAPATLTTTSGAGTATTTATSVWSGAFQVTYTDTDSQKKDVIMVVVNASACAPGASTPPAPPTSDTPCAAPAYPTLVFSPASQFFHWPAELARVWSAGVLWCVVPPQSCIDQTTQDIDTFQSTGLGSVMPELQTAITAAQTCTGPGTDTLNFYTLADFQSGCVYGSSGSGGSGQARTRSAMSRLPSVASRYDAYSTPAGTTVLMRSANASTGTGGRIVSR